MLQRVLDEFSESEEAAANGERVTPSSVKILADMRRCAYDLDFLISHQPRHASTKSRNIDANWVQGTAPNELEYLLDVFDFFNMPRMPMQTDGSTSNGVANVAMGGPGLGVQGGGFTWDVGSDWFMNNGQV